MVCPNCGSRRIHTITDRYTEKDDYNLCNACIGVLLFDWVGLLCGFCGRGEKTTTRVEHICQDCGKRF